MWWFLSSSHMTVCAQTHTDTHTVIVSSFSSSFTLHSFIVRSADSKAVGREGNWGLKLATAHLLGVWHFFFLSACRRGLRFTQLVRSYFQQSRGFYNRRGLDCLLKQWGLQAAEGGIYSSDLQAGMCGLALRLLRLCYLYIWWVRNYLKKNNLKI